MNSNSPTIDVPTLAGVSAPTTAVTAGAGRGRRPALGALLAVALLVAFGMITARAWRQGDLQGQLSLARVSLREFQPDQAVSRLTSVVADHPDCAEAEFLLASAYRRAGRLDLVEPHLRRASQLGWADGQVDRQFCLTFFQAGDFRRSASDLMDQLQDQASDDEADEVYEAMARGYIAAMLLKQATFVLDGWLTWRPCAQAHLLRADVAALAGDQQLEIECYRSAVRCEPSSFEAQRMLARSSMWGHDLEAAEILFRSCLRQRPRDPEILLGLAECQERRGEQEEAKKLVTLVLSSQPNDRQRAAALALLGQTALAAKDNAEAIRHFQASVEADPSNMAAVYSLARSLSRAGRGDEANVHLERWQRLKSLDQTLDDLRSQLLQHPQDPDLRAEIGDALLEQGATKIGVNWLLSVLLYEPTHAFANRRLAEHYEREGQTQLALSHRAIAEANNPAAVNRLSSEQSPVAASEAAANETAVDVDTSADVGKQGGGDTPGRGEAADGEAADGDAVSRGGEISVSGSVP